MHRDTAAAGETGDFDERPPVRANAPKDEAGKPIDIARALLRPGAIALVGVGNDPTQADGIALDLLRRHDFKGAVYPVNAARGLVQGAHAWPSLEALPSRPDLALILGDGDAAIEAVEACGDAGVPAAIVQSDLGGEASEAGRARHDRILAAARHHKVRLVGPGAFGVIVPAAQLALASEPGFAGESLRGGRIMALCQGSGALGALYARATAQGIGFAAMIGLGAGLDVSLGEIGIAAAEDPDVDVFLVLANLIRNPAALAEFAAAAHAADKPILVHKLRRSGEAGGPHGADDAADAFFRAHGLLRVEHFDTLFELAPMMVRRRPARGRAAGIVSCAPGAGPLVADRLAAIDTAVADLDDLARERLALNGVSLPAGPVAEIGPDALAPVLGELLDAPNNDIVLAILGAAAGLDAAAAVAPLAAAARESDKALAALVMPDAHDALSHLAASGIGAFRTIEAAADGVRSLLQWRPPVPPKMLWEDGPARPGPRHRMHAGQAIQVFKLLGIPIPTMLWLRRDAVLPKSLPFPPPYVVKVLSPDIERRREIGGLALDLETVTAVSLAANHVMRQVGAARPEAYLDGLMIQRMERGLMEVAIGFHRDPEIGPIVTLAPGGDAGDVYRDRAVRLAPVETATAFDMIDEVRGLAPLRGHRNRPRGDLDALAQALVALSSLANLASPRVIDARIDPLLVKREGDGIVVLDGTMLTE